METSEITSDIIYRLKSSAPHGVYAFDSVMSGLYYMLGDYIATMSGTPVFYRKGRMPEWMRPVHD